MITHHGKKFIKYYPQHMILLSLVAFTLIGTMLLALPIARTKTISLIDLFFTAASLTTVTGIMTISLDSFSSVGHLIILCLMQIGGLGLMTLSLVFMYMFTNLGVYTQVVASKVLSIKNFKDTKQILFFMCKLTFILEAIGALLILPTLCQTYSLKRAIFLSIFHSVSCFCNAGICLFPEGVATLLDNPFMMVTSTVLMTAGGLGFVTWHEVVTRLRSKGIHKGLSWHTKLVFKVYAATTIITGALFWILERNNTLAKLPFLKQFSAVVFASISMKSTGFAIFPFTMVHLATLVLCMVSMFIGSAPLSTGSGIKTSIFAIYIAVISAAISGQRHAVLFGRHIVDEQVYKSMAVIALSMSWILVATFCLLITEPNYHFIDILFETVSAFTNNGITTNITPYLSIFGKLFICSTMLVGRIGALAVVMSMKRFIDTHEIIYPKERIIMG